MSSLARARRDHSNGKIGAARETGADAVEMESEVIRAMSVGKRASSASPCASISDAAHEDLPLDFNALMTPETET